MTEQAVCLDNELLLESATEIFDTMVYLELEEAEEPDLTTDNFDLLGSITFKGSLDGCMSVRCSSDCAKTIAANMLGIDSVDEVSEEDMSDAIGEIVNMVMGSIKARLQDHIGGFEVSIPTVASGHQIKGRLVDGADKISVLVNIEDEFLAELSLSYRRSNTEA